MRSLWMAIAALIVSTRALSACNYTEGPCYRREDIEDLPGAGGGPIVPGWGGGYGDVPPEPQDAEPQPVDCNLGESEEEEPEKGEPSVPGSTCGAWPDTISGSALVVCGGPCEAQCLAGKVTVVTFQPADFKFMTIVPDDGTGVAGGWQGATAVLPFYRWTSLLPEKWTCKVTVEMAMRSKAYGPVSAEAASYVTASVANKAGKKVLDMVPDLPSGVFCVTFKSQMEKLFAEAPLNTYYGARVK